MAAKQHLSFELTCVRKGFCYNRSERNATMPVIDVRALEIIISNLPQIAKELKRIGDILEGEKKDGEC